MLQDRLAFSERRACQIAGQHRSTQRHEPARARDDAALRTRLGELSRERPRWGYRRAHARLLEEGWALNRKRVQRFWREEGLRVPVCRRKRRRLGESTVPADRLRAERPDQVWALDFQFDQTSDGRILHVVDEHTREALAVRCARRIDADKTVAVLERLVAERGTAPEHIRCDNGPELTANALRDWCRFSSAGASYIDPGSPWQNPYVESFGSRVRDELLGVELFATLTEAQVMVADWRTDYNECRPHLLARHEGAGELRARVGQERRGGPTDYLRRVLAGPQIAAGRVGTGARGPNRCWSGRRARSRRTRRRAPLALGARSARGRWDYSATSNATTDSHWEWTHEGGSVHRNAPTPRSGLLGLIGCPVGTGCAPLATRAARARPDRAVAAEPGQHDLGLLLRRGPGASPG